MIFSMSTSTPTRFDVWLTPRAYSVFSILTTDSSIFLWQLEWTYRTSRLKETEDEKQLAADELLVVPLMLRYA